MPNAILERIHQVLENLARNFNINQNYVDKDDQLTVILAAADFAIRSTTNRLKGYSPDQLIFGNYMTLPINNMVD